jgi:sensor histidine kinase YesM
LFDFEIIVADEAFNHAMIPRHLIYTFVENALKHGLRPKGKDGHLKIEVFVQKDYLEILVDDNGVGRIEQLQNFKMEKTNGIAIINQVIELFEKLKDVKIQYQFIDKVDEHGQPSGTSVKIKMPLIEG